MTKQVTTYSMLSRFRSCRKACEWRYIHGLAPKERDRSLYFGVVIHECLRLWHQDRDIDKVIEHIDKAYPERSQDNEQKHDWHIATAMMRGYAARYPEEDFEIIALEKPFRGKIINPETGKPSRKLELAGRVDGIICQDGRYYLLEHKTVSSVAQDYIELLWMDFQVHLYAMYIEQTQGIHIIGVLYNLLVKAQLRQGGITKTRSVPESDEAFHARLMGKYSDPEMYKRVRFIISHEMLTDLQSELWELAQAFKDAKRRNVFYKNTSFCFYYRKPCEYLPLCKSGGSEDVVNSLYRKMPAMIELDSPGVDE